MLFLIESGPVTGTIICHGTKLPDLENAFVEEIGALLSIGGVSVLAGADADSESEVAFDSAALNERVADLRDMMMSGKASRFRFNDIVLTVQQYRL